MRVFVTAASGYIGGSVAAALRAAGHDVVGLVRSDARAAQVRERGIEPLIGTLEDAVLLAHAARAADAVVNAADAGHRGVVEATLNALAGSGKAFLQTSGSSIVADLAAGEPTDKVYDEETPVHPAARPQGAGGVERCRAGRRQGRDPRRGDLPEPDLRRGPRG